MDNMELIRTRKSVRTFDGRNISDADKEKLTEYIGTIVNPYDIPVEFILLNAQEHGLSSSVIKGEQMYITAKVPMTEHCEEAFGYSFEKMVLYAWSLGIGTTWIGGTMKREIFEKAAGISGNEIMPCISPLGYPAKKRSVTETAMRTAIRADKRKPDKELFFENDFSTPIITEDEALRTALEAVKLAPSAVNKQPWRIVKKGSDLHFYEEHSLAGAASSWDVQKVDMGIAICHLMTVANGKLTVSDPGIGIPDNTEYIATVSI
ncbi:MAG: nitroreductase family protein [Ruminiclostridium sp.]|nr:nitroreductase family protein [Ruminiclostridium sp.]